MGKAAPIRACGPVAHEVGSRVPSWALQTCPRRLKQRNPCRQGLVAGSSTSPTELTMGYFGLLTAATLIAACSTPVFAQSQQQMNRTASQQLASADQTLNVTYRAQMERLRTSDRTLLRTAQRTWINFRDQQCAFEAAAVRGGTSAPLLRANCATRLTIERTRQLRAISQCEEGDIACRR